MRMGSELTALALVVLGGSACWQRPPNHAAEQPPTPSAAAAAPSERAQPSKPKQADCGAKCRSRSWGEAVALESDDLGLSFFPDVAIDRDGSAIVVWYREFGRAGSILATRFDVGTRAWGAIEEIDDTKQDARAPDIAMTEGGDAIVVWAQEKRRLRYQINSARYDAASKVWSPAVPIESDDAGDFEPPMVVSNERGHAVAVWERREKGGGQIWANHFDARAVRWSTAVRIEDRDVANAGAPWVAIDDEGNALAVWLQHLGGPTRVRANRFDAAAARWGSVTELDDISDSAGRPHVVMNGQGQAFASWDGGSPGQHSLRLAAYDRETRRWGRATLVDARGSPHWVAAYLAINDRNRAVMSWQQRRGKWMTVAARHFDPRQRSWSDAAMLATEQTGNAHDSRAALDAAGNVIVAWHQSDGKTPSVYAARFDRSREAWEAAVPLENEPDSADWLELAMAANGSAVAVWAQHDGPRCRIYANRFD